MNVSDILNDIKQGRININTQEIFLSSVIKGLLYNLNNDIKIRNVGVPHIILHTGDDRMWLETRGYNAGIEPLTISNENAVYSIIPKCIVNVGGIDLDTAQLTSPYSLGSLQYSNPDIGTVTLSGEFRRVPIKLSVELKYYTDSYTDMLELIQYVISNLAFIQTYDIVYMGQKIKCSYKIPESFSEEHTMELDGALSENREHTLNMSVEVETNVPIFNNQTIMLSDKIITKTVSNIYTKINEAE